MNQYHITLFFLTNDFIIILSIYEKFFLILQSNSFDVFTHNQLMTRYTPES